jgi:hypothetical protein
MTTVLWEWKMVKSDSSDKFRVLKLMLTLHARSSPTKRSMEKYLSQPSSKEKDYSNQGELSRAQ